MMRRNKHVFSNSAIIEPLEHRLFLSGTPASTAAASTGLESSAGGVSVPVSPVAPGSFGTGIAVHAVQGVAFDDELGTFHVLPSTLSRQYFGTVHWGDGTSSAATFVSASATSAAAVGAGTVEVFGSHTYGSAGTFDVVVDISTGIGIVRVAAVPGPEVFLGALQTTAKVAASPLTFTAVAGTPYDGTVGSFATTVQLADFTTIATISWGDGTSSTGTIVYDGDGVYHVDGTHDYTKAGDFTVNVVVTAESRPATGSTAGVVDPIVILVASFDSTAKVISDVVTAAGST